MTFKKVSPGEPFHESAEFRNAVIDLLHREFNIRKGFGSGTSVGSREPASLPRTMCIKAEENIPMYSIFTIQKIASAYDSRNPIILSDQVGTYTKPDVVYCVNVDQSMGINGYFNCYILGNDIPRIVTYEDADPTVGDELGVKPNTYKVSKSYKGLVAVSEPDTNLKRVWVVRKEGQFKLYKVEAKYCHYPGDEAGTGGQDLFDLYEFNEASCDWVDTTEDVVVHDPEHRVMMLPGERHFVIKYECTQETYYEFLGEYGLSRKAKAVNSIGADQLGAVTIWKDDEQAACIPIETICSVLACNNWGYTKDVAAGDELFIRYHEFDWYIVSYGSKDELLLVRAKACFYPGEDANFDVYTIVADTPVDTGIDVHVHDLDFDNCFLPDEFSYVKISLDGRYDLVGSKGLQRGGVITAIHQEQGTATPDGLCDLYDVTIYTRAGDQSITCEGVATQCIIHDVCPPNATWDRKWKVGERVAVWYDKGKRKWFLHSVVKAQRIFAQLNTKLCYADETASVSNPKYMDMAEDCDYTSDISTAINPMKHQGPSGANVILEWDDDLEKWVVVDVEKQIYSQPVTETNLFIRYGTCKIEGNVLPDIGLETCEVPSWLEQIPMYQRNIVESIDQSGGLDPTGTGNLVCPTISAMKGTACFFEDSNAVEEAVMEFQLIDVCTDITDDGSCVKAHYQAICVANYESEEVTEDIICCQDCITDTGTGQY